MRTLKFTLQYDGTDYVGWQRQENGVSIQGLLEDALQRIEGTPVTVHGAGRTDAGVHALGQVAHATLTASIAIDAVARALNAVLPHDVRVTAVEDAAPDFHARFSAAGKVYRYRILNGVPGSPFDRRYSWHVRPSLDFDAMVDARAVLPGTHDYAAFAAAGGPYGSTVRTITELRLTRGFAPWKVRGTLMTLDVEGDGFLRHMVRNIVGTLVDVGLRRWPPSRVAEILASRDRTLAGPTAPASGLFLVRVHYR